MAASEELLKKIFGEFKAYIGGTAALDEAFTDIRHFLTEIPEPERTSIIRDKLLPFALEEDLKKEPSTASHSLSIALVLVIRLWAAVGRADEISGYIFSYVNSSNKSWQ